MSQVVSNTLIAKLVNCTRTYEAGGSIITAMDGVDLEVHEGDFVALCGPSGSGKTTTLNVIGGLDRPDTGKVELDGVDLGSLSRAALSELRLRKIGFVFQAYNLVPVLSAVENVAFVLELAGVRGDEAESRAREVLKQVGLCEQADRRPGQMSGGQQQRVAVARAIVSRPRLVLADEPTANLDTATARSLLDLLSELNSEHGVTMVFSSHDARVMERARRLVHLVDGRIDRVENRQLETG